MHHLGDVFQINPLENRTRILRRLYYASQAWAPGWLSQFHPRGWRRLPKFGVAKYVTMTYCICMKKNCNPMDRLWQFVVGKHPWCHPSLTHMKHKTVLPLLAGFHYIRSWSNNYCMSNISCYINNDCKSIKLILGPCLLHTSTHTQCTHTHVLTKACSGRVTQLCLPSKAHLKNTVGDRTINSKEGCTCHMMWEMHRLVSTFQVLLGPHCTIRAMWVKLHA